MEEVGRWVTGGLVLVNQVLSATVVLTSFSLFLYLLTHNFRSRVARAFCALLIFVLFVYAGDVVLYAVQTPEAAERWLKFQWIGIAFVPAAYLQFSDAVLRTTGLRARWRGVVVVLSYAASTVFLGLVLYSDLLVHDGTFEPHAYHLAAGPLFWVFALYFVAAVVWGAVTVRRARERCLARASRRRMAYLGLASVAPALGVFPYLMVTSIQSPWPANLLQLLLLVGNVGVLLMMVLMSYSVAYFGALTPDRVIKHNLIHYLLRGPVVGAIVIFTMLAVFIASLGLFGLTSFVVDRKIKEIGIRKVLGATVPGIVGILSMTFTKWILVANVLAWPAAWFAMNRWLQNFAYRVNIGWFSFLLAGLLALIIALVTVSFQTVKAAMSNPVDALKYE